MDAKPNGWRFYDEDNSVEFMATVRDDKFLNEILKKKYDLKNADIIKVKLKETKKVVNQRKRTERVVIEVLVYLKSEE